MIRLSIRDITYIIEGNKTTCSIQVFPVVYGAYDLPDLRNMNQEKYDTNQDFVFKATAVCHESDIYDKDTGKRIAFCKAKINAYKHFLSIYYPSITHRKIVLEEMETDSRKIAVTLDNETKYYNKFVYDNSTDEQCGNWFMETFGRQCDPSDGLDRLLVTVYKKGYRAALEDMKCKPL